MSQAVEESDASLLADERLIGTQLGPYRLDSVLGRGGMGVVYRGTRVADFTRTVAIKVVRSDRSRSETLRRFENERVILSRLSHPSIAPLLDGGSTPDGRPYLVMPLIEGERIDTFVDRWELEPREIAELLVPLCRALGHAHECGIYHRDLKPGNVLVTEDRHVIVTDFGLAKLSETDNDETRTEELFGTLNYLPPERLSHASRGAPSEDIWGIGAILFRLLTGRPPYQLQNLNEAMEVLRSSQPPSVEEYVNDVPAELQFIASKCLEPDPAARYSCPDAVADELRRYLTGHPLKARPIPRWKRWWYWGRRHPRDAGLIGASIAIAFISLLGLMILWRVSESRRLAERQARESAEAQQQLAMRHQQRVRSAVDTMFNEVSKSLNSTPFTGEVRERLLNSAAEAYEDLATDVQGDAELRSASGTAYFRLAEIRRWLGDQQGSQEAFRRSRDSFASILKKSPNDQQARFDLFHTLLCLGQLDEAIGHIRMLVEIDPQHPDYRDCLAAALKQKAASIMVESPSQAKALAQEAAKLGDELLKEFGLGEFRSLHAATSRVILAKILIRDGDLSSALRLLDEAKPICLELVERHPGSHGVVAEYCLILRTELAIGCLHRDRSLIDGINQELDRVTERLVQQQPDGVTERTFQCEILLENGMSRWWVGDQAGAERYFASFDELARNRDGENEQCRGESYLLFYASCPVERFRSNERVEVFFRDLPTTRQEALAWAQDRSLSGRTISTALWHGGRQEQASLWRAWSEESRDDRKDEPQVFGALPSSWPDAISEKRLAELAAGEHGEEALLMLATSSHLLEWHAMGFLPRP